MKKLLFLMLVLLLILGCSKSPIIEYFFTTDTSVEEILLPHTPPGKLIEVRVNDVKISLWEQQGEWLIIPRGVPEGTKITVKFKETK